METSSGVAIAIESRGADTEERDETFRLAISSKSAEREIVFAVPCKMENEAIAVAEKGRSGLVARSVHEVCRRRKRVKGLACQTRIAVSVGLAAVS